MGEYAKRLSDGETVKIGVCETMYYCRYEDRMKFLAVSNSLNPVTTKNLFWRLPLPEEDGIEPGSYTSTRASVRLFKRPFPKAGGPASCEDYEIQNVEPGSFQMRHESGLLLNVACHHGTELPEASKDFKPFWNGKSWSIELMHVKNLDDGRVVPLIGCRHCGNLWRTSWDEIWDYLPESIRPRFEGYRSEVTA